MDRKRVRTDNQLDYYRKKRNKILFFALCPLFLIIVSWLVLDHVLTINQNVLLSVYMLLLIGYFILLMTNKSKLMYYTMYYQYHHMIENEVGPLSVTQTLFTPSWLKKITGDGFQVGADTQDFILYQQFADRLEGIVNAGRALVCIVIAKHRDTDFYGDDIQSYIEKAYVDNRHQQRFKNQIIMQFKRYDCLDEAAKNDIIQIVNYKNLNQQLIHVTVGYLHDEKKVYFLHPMRRYPNKYYYYACQQIKKYCGIKE